MPLLTYQQKIVDLMIQSELTLAELYLFLSKRYSPEAEFWLSLQREELEHAQWIEYLKSRVSEGTALFYEDQTRPLRIESFIGHVNNTLTKFKTRKMPLIAALSLAADIEASMLEQKVFQHFEGDDLDLVQTLRKLSADTEKHLQKVKDKWRNTRE